MSRTEQALNESLDAKGWTRVGDMGTVTDRTGEDIAVQAAYKSGTPGSAALFVAATAMAGGELGRVLMVFTPEQAAHLAGYLIRAGIELALDETAND